ncbi:GNAT family N-acetyltransferase [Citreimonas salinaria]|uniref:Ribosomal protein S18 acetylase RimI n=1 Tax=Citreimonas salinaria TaxID=321339 RepID=A0A1H3IKK8_9RHOB|nr:GNAT family N-acetyltransferase [Citreimonas salinaria]SDY28202.1 Ribosomal protein S18 acetylase RimI [Citreimonas salinaria]
MTKPSALGIRPLTPEDAAAWRVLWTDYLAFYETRLDESVKDATFARLLDPAEPAMNALLAELDGKPVGLVHYIFHRHCWRIEDVCYLQDLFTAPEARGRGVARALIEAVYARADANGTPQVYWTTQEFNHTARALYDKVARLTPFIKYQRP